MIDNNKLGYDRVVIALLEADPDVVVDVLKITTEELVEMFADKVEQYIEGEL